MPFFTRVFRGKDSTKKAAKSPAIEHDPTPPRPSWTDAWQRTEVAPEEVKDLLRGCTHELKARALDTPFLLLPFRPSSDASNARSFIRNFFNNSVARGAPVGGDELAQELRLTDPMVLCSVLKWCWSRLPGGVVTWEAYEMFKVGEQDAQMARDAFSIFIPISVENDSARTQIIFDFFDLLTAIAAHGKSNGLGGRKLSRYAGWWAFEHTDSGNGFEAAYKHWAAAADATSHLFFAYLRSISPDLPRGMSGISSLPIALQTLVQATEYPPEAPTLLQVSTTKVVMIVDTVSPTPFALLRRAKNFEYRDSDHHLQEFSGCEDPIQALTDECLRVLRRIASGNQVEQTPGEKAPDNQDESWSRFEDIGFGNSLETELAEDGAAQTSDFSGGLKSAPQSSAGDLGRPTTPSWADFMSEGFTGDENLLKTPVAAPLLLPPDKKLPPLSTGRGHSSQSHKRTLDSQTDPEPGELASITNLDLDDSFWWVWISSLAGEEPATRKAVFGRCALVETIIRGAKWLVLEEQVRGAAPEPDPGAYIAEKKRFFSLSSRMGKLSRRKSSARKATPMEESYNRADNTAPLSKTSIGPDQHAKIQAAAAALQKKHREQAEGPILHGSSSKTDVSNMSHSRANHSTTPQPSILNEASHAMKWAKNYDKDAFRAAYLGDNRAGKGSTDALKPQSIEEKPSTPTSEAPSMGTPLPSVSEPEEENTPTPGTPVAQNEAAEAAEAPAPKPEAPAAPAEPTESAAPAEAAEAPVEAPAGRPSSSRPVSGTPSAGLEPTITSSPSQPKQSTDSADDSGKKLRKKTGASGFKSIFSTRKKTIENPESKPSMKPTGAETSAVAAARAALEQKAKESQEPSMRPPSGPSVLRKKPVGEGPKPSSKDADGPETVRTSESAVPVATEPVAEPTLDATQTEPEAKKSTEPEITEIPDPDMPGVPSESDDHLSRVDTLEQAAADREFSRFDQGPLVEQPAFSPDSPGSPVSPVSERSSGSTAAEEESAKASIGATSAAAAAASSDRWAQIRKNAAERAAQNQSETDSGPDYNSGDLSEELTKDRAARIKARVAAMTRDMEAARYRDIPGY